MAPSNLRLWLRPSCNDDAVLSRVDSTFLAALSLVFLEGVWASNAATCALQA